MNKEKKTLNLSLRNIIRIKTLNEIKDEISEMESMCKSDEAKLIVSQITNMISSKIFETGKKDNNCK